MRACLLVLLLARPGFGEDVDRLAKAIADPDPAVRLEAVKKLRAMGPLAAPAVEALVDAAYDETREVQYAAIRALRAIGPAARTAVYPLQELRDREPDMVRRLAELALAAIGTAGVPPPKLYGARKKTLLAALESADSRTRGQAAFYLRKNANGDVSLVEPLAAALDHTTQYARQQIVKTLRFINRPQVSEAMLTQLKHKDARRRRLALACMYVNTPQTMSAAVAALDDEDPIVRRYAVGRVGGMRERGHEVVPRLLELLDSEAALRSDVLTALARMRAPGCFAVIARYLASDELSLRRHAATLFQNSYADAAALEPVLPALIRASLDEDFMVNTYAVRTLARMKAKAAPAAPFLAELAEASPTRRGELKKSLKEIGVGAPLPPPPAAGDTDALLARLAGADPKAAGRAAFQLGRIERKEARVLAALCDAMGSKRRYLRMHAALALERAGEAGIPQLIRAFKGGRSVTRRLAIQALARLGPLAKQPPAEVYLDALADPDPNVRFQAAAAVGGAGTESAIPHLIRMLESRELGVPQAALYALGRFGPRAAHAVPALMGKLADWENSSVAHALIGALGSIGEAAAPAVPLIVDAALWGNGLESTVMKALPGMGHKGYAGLVEIIRRGSGHTRSAAIGVILRKNLRLPGLREALEGAAKDPLAKSSALRALEQIGRDEPVDVDALMQAMRQEPGKTYTRSRIPFTLAKVATPDALIPYLGHQDERLRWCAWWAMAQMDAKVFGPKHKLALEPLLVEALGRSTPERAAAAAMLTRVPPTRITFAFLRALGDLRLGKATLDALVARPDAIAQISAALKHRDFDVHKGALSLVHAMGPKAKDVLPSLCAAMAADKGHGTYYLSAMLALREHALPFLLDYLPEAKRNERNMLFNGIGRFGEAALPVMRQRFAHGDAATRRTIVHLLWRFGDKGLPILLKAARDGDSKVRSAAYSYLGQLPDHADKSVPILVAALPDKNALSALRALGKRAEGGIRKAAASKEPAVRVAAMQALNRFGKDALPLVIAGLEDKDPTVRRAAIDAAGALGGRAASLVPRLHKALKDPSPLVRREAAVELPKLGGAARVAIPEIVKMFVQGNRYDRGAASTSLQRFGAPALPHLAALLAHKDKDVAKQAARTLRKIGQPAIGVLIQRFEKGPESARDHAGQVLVSLRAAESLAGLLAHKSVAVRRIAAWRLGQLQRSAIPAISALIKTLVDKDVFVVGQAAWALGEIGPAAEAALPGLEKLVRSGRSVDIARDAIKKIRG